MIVMIGTCDVFNIRVAIDDALYEKIVSFLFIVPSTDRNGLAFFDVKIDIELYITCYPKR